MIKENEEYIIQPPLEFRDDYKPLPKLRTKTATKKPTPYPRTKITFRAKALTSGFESFNVKMKNNKDPLLQLFNTSLFIENFIKNLLKEKKGLKFNQTLAISFIRPTTDRDAFDRDAEVR